MSSLSRGYFSLQIDSSRRSTTYCSLKIGNCTVTRGNSSKYAAGSVVRFFLCL